MTLKQWKRFAKRMTAKKRKPVKATVVKVTGPDIQKDGFTGQPYDCGSFVHVREDESKVLHVFMNSSINQVAPKNRVVGTRGVITWERSAAYSLPFFITDET